MKIQNAYFIIWNSSKKNFNNIYKDIEKKTIIKNKKIIEIKKYFDLICNLYVFNNQRELGVYKATKMCDNSKYEIMILEVEFSTDKNGDFSLIKNLKKDIRNLYKFTTDNYFHDNIIHGTDSLEEYDYVKNIVNNINNYQ